MPDSKLILPVPAHLPEQRVTRLVEPITNFLQVEAMSGVVLLAATVAALFLANSAWAESYLTFWNTPVGVRIGSLEIAHSLKHVINDGLMTLFFFVVGLEIKRELLLGELKDLRVAALPVAAALGGMLVPVGLYLSLQLGEPGESGWGVVMATDIAFVVGCLAVLGDRVPRSLRIFVLSLAIIDDIGAILVIAIGYTANLDLVALGLGVFGVASILSLRYLGVRSIAIYYLAGILTWLAVFASGVHPTIVGVVLGLLTPAYAWVGSYRFQAITHRVNAYLRGESAAGAEADTQDHHGLLHTVAVAARETLSPLERLETALHPWVAFGIMPVFAFANAGIPVTAAGFSNPLVLAVIAGLVLGKPIGIVAASWMAVRLGIATRPDELRWSVIAAAGALSGIGFTMALFIAGLALDGGLLTAAKLGILVASFVSAVIGLALLIVFLGRGQTATHQS